MLRSNHICLLILLLLLAIPTGNYSQDIRFNHLAEKDGLLDSRVNKITQDSKGFMWFTTRTGISRYDGYAFKNFKHEPYASNSISNGEIGVIYEDREEIIWLSIVEVGLDKYDPRTEQFSHYPYSFENPGSLNSGRVTDIIEDKNGLFWLGTWGGGLNLFDREHEMFTYFRHDPENPNSLSSDHINVIVEDPNSNGSVLWIGTHQGLSRFDYNHQQFTRFQHDSTQHNSLIWNWINDLQFSSTGKLWVGTSEGIDLFDTVTEEFTHFRNDPNDSNSLSSNIVGSLLEDGRGDLWVGSESRALDRIIFEGEDWTAKTAQFAHFIYDQMNQNSISEFFSISDIYEDYAGSIWIGSGVTVNYGGVDRFDPATEVFKNYQQKSGSDNSIHANYVTDVYQDPQGILWVNTERGLDVIDRNNGTYNYYKFKPDASDTEVDIILSIIPDPSNPNVLWLGTTLGVYEFSKITGIFKKHVNKGWSKYIQIDPKGNLWILRDGLHKYNPNDKSVTSYLHDPENETSISSGFKMPLYIQPGESDPILWIGGKSGVERFDSHTESFEHFPFFPDDSINIGELGRTKSFTMDSQGYLWISSMNFLHKFDPETGDYTHFKPPDSWDMRGAGKVAIDNQGNIWEGATNSLWRFNPQTEAFKQFGFEHGLTKDGISLLLFNNQTGEMFACGDYGLNSFFPDQIQENMTIPPIVLTSFKKLNKEVELDSSVSYINHITLEPHENVFSFEFAALNFVNPQKNQYAYRMDGFDDDWILTDASNRDANYTNLDPGDYTFRVKGSNNDGLWNETGASVKVTILPHWWESNLAYFVYFLLFLGALYKYRNFELNRLKLHQQYELEHFEANKLKEIDQVKSRFFANISHEFRTPLTLILGPIRKMLTRAVDPDSQNDLNLMQRQAKHLLDLVSQLLDLSKLEAGKLNVQVSKRNIVPLLKGLTLSFASLAERDRKILSFDTDLEEIQIYVNKEAITRIMNNLLSNAFKFTTDTGSVGVDVKVLPDSESFIAGSLEVSVSDNGIGIPHTRIEKVFDRFYQVDNSVTRERDGTGIGLALTKELVELHHGTIEASSGEKGGTTFTIQLPLGRAHLKAEEIFDPDEQETDEALDDQLTVDSETSFSTKPNLDESKPILLIVEDNVDVRNYIRSDLEELYNCYEAIDGEAGLEQARELIPDLIISDVMMPKMGGIEFCEKIKTDELTSHIPVILLTAKADLESKLEGLETGADDYLTKPFETQELQIRIKNLIEQRELLRERFQKDSSLVPEGLNLSSMDEQFLEKASEIIRDHLTEQEFSVDILSNKIFMSRQHLNRKLKAITGRTAVQFIRIVRLKSAIQLLTGKQATIAEIAYQVGFGNTSHFSRVFQEEYSCSPSEYQEKHTRGKL